MLSMKKKSVTLKQAIDSIASKISRHCGLEAAQLISGPVMHFRSAISMEQLTQLSIALDQLFVKKSHPDQKTLDECIKHFLSIGNYGPAEFETHHVEIQQYVLVEHEQKMMLYARQVEEERRQKEEERRQKEEIYQELMKLRAQNSEKMKALGIPEEPESNQSLRLNRRM